MKTHLSGRALKHFRSRLLGWFREHRRELPWRVSRDPYRIWIAEVMLQQTRIAAVIPYYERFLSRFPDFKTLAEAPQPDVLKLWSGLGYYSRARNLHAAAKKIVADFGGKFPRELNHALELPGIGAYTAAAVLSIAYDVPLAVLDGNVARVLARLNAVRGELRAPRTWKALGDSVQKLLAEEAAGDWNQALMELGEVTLHAAESAVLALSGGEIVPGAGRRTDDGISGAAKKARTRKREDCGGDFAGCQGADAAAEGPGGTRRCAFFTDVAVSSD